MKILTIIQKIKYLFSKYDQIISIEQYGNNDVIDIEVNGNHLFYANGLLTHNSGQGGGYAGADISMENVSESSGITATADALIALYQLQGEHEAGRINVKILKNRLGGYNDRTFPLKVDYNTLKISDAESSEQGSTGDKLLDDCQDANQNLIKKTKKEKQDTSKHDYILNNI